MKNDVSSEEDIEAFSIKEEPVVGETPEEIKEEAKDLSLSSADECDSPMKLVFGEKGSDVKYKAAIRLVRRFYREMFKTQNKNLVRIRYTNCNFKQIYSQMKQTLKGRIPEEDLTKDLIYFILGILKLSKNRNLP